MLTQKQVEIVQKAYGRLMDGKNSYEQFEKRIKKFFLLKEGFKETVIYCLTFYKGSSEITWYVEPK